MTLPQTSYAWTGLLPGARCSFWVEAIEAADTASRSDLVTRAVDGRPSPADEDLPLRR